MVENQYTLGKQAQAILHIHKNSSTSRCTSDRHSKNEDWNNPLTAADFIQMVAMEQANLDREYKKIQIDDFII
jgi:hypothetical protein